MAKTSSVNVLVIGGSRLSLSARRSDSDRHSGASARVVVVTAVFVTSTGLRFNLT
jgi:hypothetical protein